MPEGGRVKFENSPTELKLVNKKAEKGDSGRYTLTAENEMGKDTATVNVSVVGRLIWVIGRYTFTAENEIGKDTAMVNESVVSRLIRFLMRHEPYWFLAYWNE